MLDHVYQLRYECYHRCGAIGNSAEERFSDSNDALPNHFRFLASNKEEGPLGTVRISVVRPAPGWGASPAAKVFGDHEAFLPCESPTDHTSKRAASVSARKPGATCCTGWWLIWLRWRIFMRPSGWWLAHAWSTRKSIGGCSGSARSLRRGNTSA